MSTLRQVDLPPQFNCRCERSCTRPAQAERDCAREYRASVCADTDRENGIRRNWLPGISLRGNWLRGIQNYREIHEQCTFVGSRRYPTKYRRIRRYFLRYLGLLQKLMCSQTENSKFASQSFRSPRESIADIVQNQALMFKHARRIPSMVATSMNLDHGLYTAKISESCRPTLIDPDNEGSSRRGRVESFSL